MLLAVAFIKKVTYNKVAYIVLWNYQVTKEVRNSIENMLWLWIYTRDFKSLSKMSSELSSHYGFKFQCCFIWDLCHCLFDCIRQALLTDKFTYRCTSFASQSCVCRGAGFVSVVCREHAPTWKTTPLPRQSNSLNVPGLTERAKWKYNSNNPKHTRPAVYFFLQWPQALVFKERKHSILKGSVC